MQEDGLEEMEYTEEWRGVVGRCDCVLMGEDTVSLIYLSFSDLQCVRGT